MMFNQLLRRAFLTALVVGLGELRNSQGFNIAAPQVSHGGGAFCDCTFSFPRRPHPRARGCTCGTSAVAVHGLFREKLGGRARSRGCEPIWVGDKGDETPTASAVPVFDLDERTVEEMWMRVKKQLISVGKSGVKPSHVRSLNSLISAHTLVKVKVNIPNADLEKVGLELAGKGGVSSGAGEGQDDSAPDVHVSVVTVNSNQRVILFANTDFLAAQA